MKFRRVKHMLLRLSPEEKVTLAGGLMILIGAFLPWYQVNLKVDSSRVIVNGFSGDLGVIGFVIFLVALLATLYLVGEHIGFRLPTFGYIKEKVILFLMGQSAFLLALATLVYTKRSLDFTDAELRFGIYMALIGGILATLSAYAFSQKLKKKEVEAFFGKEESPVVMDELEEETPAEPVEVQAEEIEALEEDPQMELIEVETIIEPVEEAGPQAVEAEPVMIADEEEIATEEVIEEAPEEKEEDLKKNANPPSMNFYED